MKQVQTEVYVQDDCTGLIADGSGNTVSLVSSEAELRFEQIVSTGRWAGRADAS